MTKLLIPKQLDDYSAQHTTPETPVLAALNRETNLKTENPVMLSGHIQGMALQMISHMIRPKQVLEIGTFTGYSAICLAQGLQDGGLLHTIDVNEELEELAFRYICIAGLDGKIRQYIGKAADIIPGIKEQFDLVFIDADKQNYGLYYDMVFDKVPIGGFLLADNVLFEGDVLLPVNEQGKNGKAMYAFNEKIKNDNRVEQVLLPVRDGLMIMRKIAN